MFLPAICIAATVMFWLWVLMGWTPQAALLWQSGGVELRSRKASMGEVTTVGLDLAKLVFQAHEADAAGGVVFRKMLKRTKMLGFFARLPSCVVAMEACEGAHHWRREIAKFGPTVRLIPPAYVKPFVKRQKNDTSDAEAICEAAQRPTMRSVAVKSAEAQASAAIFRTRDLLVRQRTQHINAIRGQLTEHGLVVGKGPAHLPKLVALAEAPDHSLPEAAWAMIGVLVDMVSLLDERADRPARSGDPSPGTGGRRACSTDDHPWHRTDHRHRTGCLGPST